MIISVLDKSAGFYSVFFFTLNHYLTAKQNNESFVIDSHNWLFKSKYGWTDYFEPYEFDTSNTVDTDVKRYKHNMCPSNFNMWEYQSAIRSIYRLNPAVKKEIEETMNRLSLVAGEYDSIFIRRGDKLCEESSIISTELYIRTVLEKNPNCKTIFVQTDDYNCYLEVKSYIEKNGLNINIITLCNPSHKGVVVFERKFDHDLSRLKDKNSCNVNYFENIYEDLQKFKPVEKMNSEEIYRHTVDMLVGIDIVMNSNICILDYQSNAARFVYVAHYKNTTNVYDVRYPKENINMGWTSCPAYW